jgi:YggT family protein
MSHVLATFVTMLSLVLTLLILARVLLSWTNGQGGGAFTAFIYQATEPILGPIRRVLPPMGGLDWSPFIALVLLTLITRLFTQF